MERLRTVADVAWPWLLLAAAVALCMWSLYWAITAALHLTV